MTDTPNLALPYIEASQAQKHVTHNEALRILDAAIQIAVLDMTRTTPPPTPAAGERHVVATGATGAWAGQSDAIASWQDGAWAFLAPKPGWCVWSVADDGMMVFDGTLWRAAGAPSLDSVAHLGINTSADASNLLSVRSNAALLAAIAAADGGSGDVRLQLSKTSAANTASVVFSDNFSGRAEFGLVGADAFKLKVSADGTSFVEAFTIDQASGNLALPRGLSLSGVIAPAQLTASQNDYNPAGLGAATVLQLSADAARSISGLAGGAEGRIVTVINVGSQPLTLLDEAAASAAANRFSLGCPLVVAARQAAILRYDGTAARWQAIASRGNAAAVPTPQGRLSLSPGVAVPIADQTAKATIYYTASSGCAVPVYDGSGVRLLSVASDLVLALDANSGHAQYVSAGNTYDLFVAVVAGTGYFGHSPAWSSDTVRAAALARGAGHGLLANAAAMSLRYGANAGDVVTVPAGQATWLGTFRSTANGQTEDSAVKRFLANAYNAVPRDMVSGVTGNVSTSGTSFAANAAALRLDWVSIAANGAVQFAQNLILSTSIAGGRAETYLRTDGTAIQDTFGAGTSALANDICSFANGMAITLPDGVHYVESLQANNGGSSTIYGGASGTRRSSIKGVVMN